MSPLITDFRQGGILKTIDNAEGAKNLIVKAANLNFFKSTNENRRQASGKRQELYLWY